MPVTTTKAAAHIMAGSDPRLEENASAKLARKRAEAQRASAALHDAPDTTTPMIGRAPLETLPDPPLFDDAPPAAPLTLNAIHRKLCKPFAAALVELKPGATTQDKSRALCMPFVDSRAYQTRLDRVVGPEGWAVEYRPLSDRAVLCRLTILGVTREDVGECNAADENAATSAVAQSFKRACSAFGLGRYLYSLPQIWAAYDEKKRQIVDVAGVVAQMYAKLPRGEE
jgi:hypothetical protein